MQKIGIICKTGISEPVVILKELLPWLKQKGYETFVDVETASVLNIDGFSRSQIPSLSDMVIVLGGDGTLISTCRLVADKGVPVRGVNIGGLGFLAEIPAGEVCESGENGLPRY